ncbi:DNA gyrase inhibitor YacG [Celeribacter ethanolicus]|uniref:DNA gyrase inhibitor YacG n=1 Tax=Celeribacter ethanolicus TaxID=1758178 RepID=A0A291GGV8_9RHOB|nr:DNA gyrase inhibitor YacG [Celeribacter ethanolicus]ATG49292.1 DNA gyrase inhibitor YacG [Celeribacter ethanolicus]TNE67444.1 MAG: DNA gyrase inhibitor YacG [Paracoccaceae bacterium]
MSCPICGNESVPAYRPFCSKRCADIDLAKWLNGSYAVPSMREEDPEEIAEALEEALNENLREAFEDGAKKPH